EDDSDYVSVTFTEDVILRGEAKVTTTGDIDVNIIDEATDTLFYRSEADGDELFLVMLPAGTYTFQVNAYAAADGYTLDLRTVDFTSLGDFGAGDPISDQTGGAIDTFGV